MKGKWLSELPIKFGCYRNEWLKIIGKKSKPDSP